MTQVLLSIAITYAVLRLIGVLLALLGHGVSLTWFYNTFYPRSYSEGHWLAHTIQKVLDHFWFIQHDIKAIGEITIDPKTGRLSALLSNKEGVHRGLVVCETDLDAALQRLKRIPGGIAGRTPGAWTRKRLLDQIAVALGPNPKYGTCTLVAYGIWAFIEPIGADLGGYPANDQRKQIVLLMRDAQTDPTKFVDIGNRNQAETSR